VAPQKPAPAPAEPPPSTYPGINQGPSKPPVTAPSNGVYPGVNQTQKPEPKATIPLTPAKPPATAAEPAKQLRPTPVFHVAFFHEKSNLTSDTMNVLAAAASQVLQMERPAKIRVASLGPKEGDDVWRRRHLAIEDELVRQGVPRNQIRAERAGSQLFITIRPLKQPATPASGKRAALQLDTVGDPLVGEY
jgi:outer membrane protein OmpA-like peptidoglycan-associated protein